MKLVSYPSLGATGPREPNQIRRVLPLTLLVTACGLGHAERANNGSVMWKLDEPPPPETSSVASASPAPSGAQSAAVGSSTPLPPGMRCATDPPDPAPLGTRDWVRLRLRYDSGRVELVESRSERTERVESTERKMGRFAVELWIGCELVDRVRYNFPLLGGAEPEAGSDPPVTFASKLRAEQVVRIPDSPRATSLVLVDRATQQRTTLRWPLPVADGVRPAAEPLDAGVESTPASPGPLGRRSP